MSPDEYQSLLDRRDYLRGQLAVVNDRLTTESRTMRELIAQAEKVYGCSTLSGLQKAQEDLNQERTKWLAETTRIITELEAAT